MLTKDLAICIRAVDFSETSQIVTFFARETGKISAIAKGSKRAKSAFDGPIELLAQGTIVFSDANREGLATLTEFQQQPAFTNLSRNLFALNCCLFGTELINQLTDDYDPHPQLFDSFLRFLQDANERQASGIEHGDILALLILFQLALLQEIGLMPVLNACVNCKNDFSRDWPEIYFSSSANGLICRDCEVSFPDKIRLTKDAANCLSNRKMIAESQEKTLNEIEKVLIRHFTEILHHPPKMAKYIVGD